MQIEDKDLLNWFVGRLAPLAYASTGKQATLYRALGHLVGITAQEAVKIANRKTEKKEDRITVTEFCRWFVAMFSEFAASVIKGENDD